MPYPNEHAARVKSPGLFIRESMRSKNISNGIRIIIGKLKSNPTKMVTQAYRFKKTSYTPEQAKKWLSENNVKYISFEAARDVQSMQREIKLQCVYLKLHPQEIKQQIPINVMDEIKNRDSSPYFRAYSIMQDGIAKPRVIGESESLPTKWSRKIVESLNGIIKRGVQFFIGHNADNSTEDRKSVGEVISNFTKRIGEKLHNIVIGYFPDKIEADKYDVCSIEGNILAEDYDNYSIVRKVKDITGIALGNSAYDKPAFPGALYLGSIQAFGDDNQVEPDTSDKNKSEEITMKFEDIKKAVHEMNIFPAQLYTEDDLKSDRTFGKIFDGITKKENELTEKKKTIDTQKGEIDKLNKDITLATAKDKLEKSFPEGLTDSQKNFITKRFKPETMEDLKDETLKDFVDTSIKEFSEYASIFNNEKKEDNTDDNSDNGQTKEEDDIDKIVSDVINKQQQGV